MTMSCECLSHANVSVLALPSKNCVVEAPVGRVRLSILKNKTLIK